MSEESLVLVVAKGGQDLQELTGALTAGGFRVEAALSEEEAEVLFREHRHALALVDLRLENGAPLRVLEKLKAVDAMLPVIVMAVRHRISREPYSLCVMSRSGAPLPLRSPIRKVIPPKSGVAIELTMRNDIPAPFYRPNYVMSSFGYCAELPVRFHEPRRSHRLVIIPAGGSESAPLGSYVTRALRSPQWGNPRRNSRARPNPTEHRNPADRASGQSHRLGFRVNRASPRFSRPAVR